MYFPGPGTLAAYTKSPLSALPIDVTPGAKFKKSECLWFGLLGWYLYGPTAGLPLSSFLLLDWVSGLMTNPGIEC